MSLSFGETSLMSQKTDMERGPEMSARTSFWSSQSVKPPTGRKQLFAVEARTAPGSQLNCTCCEAVAGVEEGDDAVGRDAEEREAAVRRRAAGEEAAEVHDLRVVRELGAGVSGRPCGSAPGMIGAVVAAEPSSSLFQSLP